MTFQAAAMSEKQTGRTRSFTIRQGLAASLALHSAVCLPFVLNKLEAPDEEPSTIVFELNGVVADQQTDEKLQQETKGEAQQDAADMAKSANATAAKTEIANDEQTGAAAEKEARSTPASTPPTKAKKGSAGSNNVKGGEEQQNAQTIAKERDMERDAIKDYVRLLTKKVQSRLVYPEDAHRAGLQGAATVSFAISTTGQIRPDTLKIVTSSGQPQLDASALKTVRSSVPFNPPPREMTVAIAVAFGRKH